MVKVAEPPLPLIFESIHVHTESVSARMLIFDYVVLKGGKGPGENKQLRMKRPLFPKTWNFLIDRSGENRYDYFYRTGFRNRFQTGGDMARSTISDVARMAGVSKSTVSRVLNGNLEYIRAETLAAVRTAIDTLGYRPSTAARSLTLKRTCTVGLLISDVGNPYYPEVIRAVEEIALANGYNVFLCNTNYDVARGEAFLRLLINQQVDGVLIMSSSMSDDWIRQLGDCQIPAVVLDWPFGAAAGRLGSIILDYEAGIRQAVEMLLSLGHHHFAHISGPLNLKTSQLRRDAFLGSLASCGVDPASVVVLEGNLRIDGGKRALATLAAMHPRPTAVFAANDLTAIGLIWAARGLGLHIPEDLSVVGLDDISLAAEVMPALSTVAMPRAQIGRAAMEMLLELIKLPPDGQVVFRSVTMETRLVVRESTARQASSLI